MADLTTQIFTNGRASNVQVPWTLAPCSLKKDEVALAECIIFVELLDQLYEQRYYIHTHTRTC